jgi:hypothetical protein
MAGALYRVRIVDGYLNKGYACCSWYLYGYFSMSRQIYVMHFFGFIVNWFDLVKRAYANI